MKLEEQVVSLELARKLKELGVKQESYFMWVGENIWNSTEASDYETRSTPARSEWISAFTVAELGEMLLSSILTDEGYELGLESIKVGEFWEVHYSWLEDTDNGGFNDLPGTCDRTEADARAKMLIYLLENNLLPSSAKE